MNKKGLFSGPFTCKSKWTGVEGEKRQKSGECRKKKQKKVGQGMGRWKERQRGQQ